jgi:hypothetical protein
MKAGRVIAGAMLGFLFLLFVALDLVLFGVVALNSVVVTVLPALGLVVGAVLGVLAGNRSAQLNTEVQNGSPV